MTLTSHWSTPKTGGERCLCPKCGWAGPLSECNPRIGEVVLCPKCSHWVELRDPQTDNRVGKEGKHEAA